MPAADRNAVADYLAQFGTERAQMRALTQYDSASAVRDDLNNPLQGWFRRITDAVLGPKPEPGIDDTPGMVKGAVPWRTILPILAVFVAVYLALSSE